MPATESVALPTRLLKVLDSREYFKGLFPYGQFLENPRPIIDGSFMYVTAPTAPNVVVKLFLSSATVIEGLTGPKTNPC